MRTKDPFDEFRRILDRAGRALEDAEAFETLKERFRRELAESLSRLTYDYFTPEPPHPDVATITSFTREQIRETLAGNRQFFFSAQRIFEVIWGCAGIFREGEAPPDWEPPPTKIPSPSFTEQDVEALVQKIVSKAPEAWSNREIRAMRKSIREQQEIDKFHADYKTAIHNLLKKMALEFVPAVADMTGNGFRELDSQLYDRAFSLYLLVMDQRFTS